MHSDHSDQPIDRSIRELFFIHFLAESAMSDYIDMRK
jgi:hypothetical protein